MNGTEDCSPVQCINTDGSEIQLFPNPATKTITLSSAGATSPSIQVNLLNAGGRLLRTLQFENMLMLDISEYNEGLYYLQFLDDNVSTVKKLLIQKH